MKHPYEGTPLEKQFLEGFIANYEDQNPYGRKYPELWNTTDRRRWEVSDEFEAWRTGKEYKWRPLEVELGKLIYHNLGGSDEDYKVVTGKDRKPYKDLEQHEHGDYEWPAHEIIKFLLKHDLLKYGK